MSRIKINVDYDEYKDSLYYRNFDIVTNLPEVGDIYEGHKVLAVTPVTKDPENDDRAAKYDCFRITTKGDADEDDFDSYVAISNEDPVKTMPIITIVGKLLPTAEAVNKVILGWLHGEGEISQFANDVAGLFYDEDSDILEEYFGISMELYEDTAADITVTSYGRAKCDKNGVVPDGELCIEMSGSTYLYGKVPYWWTENECGIIDLYDNESLLVNLPERKIEDLHPHVFNAILESIEEGAIRWSDDGLVSDYPSWYDLISTNGRELGSIVSAIAEICISDFGKLRKNWGLTQAALSEKLYIPKRTIEDWCSGKRTCNIYIRLMIAETLGKIKRRH